MFNFSYHAYSAGTYFTCERWQREESAEPVDANQYLGYNGLLLEVIVQPQYVKVLTTVCSFLSVAFFLYSVYFVFFALIALIKKEKTYPETEKRNFFEIIVAARNEAEVLPYLLESLKGQDYPSDRYEIVVMPNSCTDNTKQVAMDHGARILECPFTPHTKGQLVNYAFKYFKKRKDIDAYVIFDADNVVDKSFLSHINRALEAGYEAGQGKRVGKNSSDNWLTQCYEVFFVYQNVLFNKPRTVSGINASVNGTGWFVNKKIADEEGFNMKTLTEDLEFTARCATRQHSIAYVPQAVTYDEFPSSLKVSMRQRTRWTYGQLCCLRQYWRKLIKNVGRGFSNFDVFMLFISPFVQLLSVIVGLITLSINYSTIGGLTNLAKMGVFSALASFLVMFVASSLAVKRNGMSPLKNIKGIVMFPIFTALVFPIVIYCLFLKDCEWKPILHDRKIPISEKSV